MSQPGVATSPRWDRVVITVPSRCDGQTDDQHEPKKVAGARSETLYTPRDEDGNDEQDGAPKRAAPETQ